MNAELCEIPNQDPVDKTRGGIAANLKNYEAACRSMCKALPGVEIAIARRRSDGSVQLLGPDQVGEIVLRPTWPSLFKAYLNNEHRYRESFAHGWYFSGDQARRDARGYFWLLGRSDDVIKSAGCPTSSFERLPEST